MSPSRRLCTGIVFIVSLAFLMTSLSFSFAQEGNSTRNGTISFEIDLTPEESEQLMRLAEEARSQKNTGQWPATLQEAVDKLVSGLSDHDKEKLRNTKREDLILFHMGWGMSIRNGYGLWGGNEELILSACGGKKCHPDTASMNIIEKVWESLQEKGQ